MLVSQRLSYYFTEEYNCGILTRDIILHENIILHKNIILISQRLIYYLDKNIILVS